MAINNFDQSSTGTNIELVAFYDMDLGRVLFENNFEAITRSGYTRSSYLIYTDGGQLQYTGDLNDYRKIKESETAETLFDKWVKYIENDYDGELDEFLDYTEVDNLEAATAQDVHDFVEYSLSDMESWYEFAEYETSLFKMGVDGNSQGDYAIVYYHEDHPISYEYAQELIYSSPMYVCLTIDGDELHFDEHVEDTYNYDKDEILAIAYKIIQHDNKAYILEWLEDNLPEHLDYK